MTMNRDEVWKQLEWVANTSQYTQGLAENEQELTQRSWKHEKRQYAALPKVGNCKRDTTPWLY